MFNPENSDEVKLLSDYKKLAIQVYEKYKDTGNLFNLKLNFEENDVNDIFTLLTGNIRDSLTRLSEIGSKTGLNL